MSTISTNYRFNTPTYNSNVDRPITSYNDLMQRATKSTSTVRLLNYLSATGRMPSLRIMNQSEVEPGENGHYERATNTVALNGALLVSNPNQALVTFSHELYHAADNIGGVSASVGRAFDPATAKLVTESRAYSFGAQVMRELGVNVNRFGSTAQSAYYGLNRGGTQGAYLGAWQSLHQRSGYNQGSAQAYYAPGWNVAY